MSLTPISLLLVVLDPQENEFHFQAVFACK